MEMVAGCAATCKEPSEGCGQSHQNPEPHTCTHLCHVAREQAFFAEPAVAVVAHMRHLPTVTASTCLKESR